MISEDRTGDVLTITIDNASQANALNEEMLDQLIDLFTDAGVRDDQPPRRGVRSDQELCPSGGRGDRWLLHRWCGRDRGGRGFPDRWQRLLVCDARGAHRHPVCARVGQPAACAVEEHALALLHATMQSDRAVIAQQKRLLRTWKNTFEREAVEDSKKEFAFAFARKGD